MNKTVKAVKAQTPKKNTRKNRCSMNASKLKPLPLIYFKNLAKEITQTNNTKKQKSALKKFPFCLNKQTAFKNGHIKNILEHTELSKTEKTRRITSLLIDLAWENITTRHADIGVLEDTKYCKIKKCRPIKEEYGYYKNIHEAV